jgi:hypothetical protein
MRWKADWWSQAKPASPHAGCTFSTTQRRQIPDKRSLKSARLPRLSLQPSAQIYGHHTAGMLTQCA